jgi:WD40 repeat protein
LAVAGPKLTVYDGRTGVARQIVNAGQWKEVYAVGFCQDGGLTLVIDIGLSTVIRRAPPGMEGWDDVPIDRPAHTSEVITVSNDGLVLTGCTTHTLHVWQPPPIQTHYADLGDKEIEAGRIALSDDALTLVTLTRPRFVSTSPGNVPDQAERRSSFRSRIQIWDADSLRALCKPAVLAGIHVAGAVALSSTGNRIALGCFASPDNHDRGQVLLGNVTGDGSLRFDLLGEHDQDVMALAFTRDGKMLLASGSYIPGSPASEFICWSVDDRRPLWRVPYNVALIAVVPSPDGALVALGGNDGVIRLLRIEHPNEAATLLDTEGFITGMTFSRDGNLFAVGILSGRVLIFERSDNQFSRKLQFDQHDNTIHTLVFGHDDSVLYIQGAHAVYRWDTRVWAPIEPPIAFVDTLLDFRLTPKTIVAVTTNGKLTSRRLHLSD